MGGPRLDPADGHLGVDGFLTRRARRMACLAGVNDPFRKAEVLLRELSGWAVAAVAIPATRPSGRRRPRPGAAVRRRPGLGLTGYSATVFKVNLFLVPRHLEALLALPREAFDTAEEVLAAGWRVDGDPEDPR